MFESAGFGAGAGEVDEVDVLDIVDVNAAPATADGSMTGTVAEAMTDSVPDAESIAALEAELGAIEAEFESLDHPSS